MSICYFTKTKQSRGARNLLPRIALFLFLVQALIPTGYMPASIATDGTVIKLCPSGVSPEVMAIIHQGHNLKPLSSGTKSEQNHHSHHQHIHHEMASMSADKVAESTDHDHHTEGNWQSDCKFGIAKPNSEVTFLPTPYLSSLSKTRYIQQRNLAEEVIASLHRKQQQRAPPFSASLSTI
ncbi:hypothetical protein [Microbulbifer sp. THAF38]|uniref:hypothetical protein n=1 Tax=Microbulbifer sp. THAF38 TaxID=2587856 RepID=UPI0012683423|nr:hypothetical protein [Microbulbifer sp. THAF38]